MLSEDEIEKILQESCILDELCYEVDGLEEKQLEAIRSLYLLYKQEKEKNSRIQKYVRSNEWAEDYEKSSCRTKILRILEEE